MKITEATLLPLSLVISICGASWFVSDLYSQTSFNKIQLEQVKSDMVYIRDKVDKILEKVK
jgi:hypothetical protein